MRCEEVKSKLSAYVDGETDRKTSSRVEAHLARCGGCREHLALMRELDAWVREMPGVSPGAEFTRGVIERVESLDVEKACPAPPLPGDLDHKIDAHAGTDALPFENTGPRSSFLKNFGLSWPGRTLLRRWSAGAFMELMDGLLGLIAPSRQSSTRSLEEFGDFPPCSLGSVYLGLIEQSERGLA